VTFFEAAASARATLINAGILPETAALDADLLARHAAGWDLVTWLVRRSETADERFRVRYDELLQRRLRREPVAYIRGVQEFWGREFAVTPSVLIPRPETELLVEEALGFLARYPTATVVDIGTGSGCIAVTLARECPAAIVYAVDISPPALSVARENAARHHAADRMHFVEGAYLGDTPRPVDLIVSNPPYVADYQRPGLAPEVREFEPAVALFGGNDGWRDIRHIVRDAATALRPGGMLMMELGYGQAEQIADEVSGVDGLRLEGVRDDLQGIPRVAIVGKSS
jgi:release factor glutamine methyltransferase